jgi:ribosomal protein S18 acetylase RimI-like enzyme
VVQTQYALLRNAACEGDDQRRTPPTMPAVIRLATPADADAIVAVFCSSKRPSMPWLEETYAPAEVGSYIADVLLKTTTVWVALQRGEIVGYAALHDGVLEQLFVAADFQQQGIGGQLLDAARQSAGTRMSLYVFTENQAARRFYERHGFISTDDFDAEGELDMRYEWRMPVPA